MRSMFHRNKWRSLVGYIGTLGYRILGYFQGPESLISFIYGMSLDRSRGPIYLKLYSEHIAKQAAVFCAPCFWAK